MVGLFKNGLKSDINLELLMHSVFFLLSRLHECSWIWIFLSFFFSPTRSHSHLIVDDINGHDGSLKLFFPTLFFLQNLKDQILTTNIWLEHEWQDHKFKWDPLEYGGVMELYVPSEHIW
jgi:hypothetical protein